MVYGGELDINNSDHKPVIFIVVVFASCLPEEEKENGFISLFDIN